MASCPLTQAVCLNWISNEASFLLNLDGLFCPMTNCVSLHLHLIQPLQEAVGISFLVFLGKELDPDFSKFNSLSRELLNSAVRAGILQEPQAHGGTLGPTQEKTLGRQIHPL